MSVVCPSHATIVWKRLNLSLNCFQPSRAMMFPVMLRVFRLMLQVFLVMLQVFPLMLRVFRVMLQVFRVMLHVFHVARCPSSVRHTLLLCGNG